MDVLTRGNDQKSGTEVPNVFWGLSMCLKVHTNLKIKTKSKQFVVCLTSPDCLRLILTKSRHVSPFACSWEFFFLLY